MPNFNADQLETIVRDAVGAAAAPEGSNLRARAPEFLKPIFEHGDSDDAWCFVSGCCQVIIQSLGLDQMKCTCEPVNPDHSPPVNFGFIALENGVPDHEQVVVGDKAPPEVEIFHPEIITAQKMVNAELTHDFVLSHALWGAAIRGGWMAEVMSFLLNQAGICWGKRLGAGRLN